jgi:hypothetical protein
MKITRLLLIGLCVVVAGVALVQVAGRAAAQTAETKKRAVQGKPQSGAELDFPKGTATPPVECGECHQAIYREYAFGFGTDLAYKPMAPKSAQEGLLSLKGRVSSMGTAHSISGTDPWPIHARGDEMGGKSCNVCHYPEPFEIPDLDKPEIERPKARPQGQETEGITCASCHLTPDGKIRGPYGAKAPHMTVKEPKIQTSAMCAHCHSAGKRVVGKQTQTFLEWRDDFFKPGLGKQQCQDCHMTRTLRKLAEDEDGPVRPVARHTWTGGHSPQRVSSALNMVIVADEKTESNLKFHLTNISAAHSVPTGSNRRGIFLKAEVVDGKGNTVATREWLFAPWYGDRPDDKAFLEEDKKRPDAVSAIQADAQGPHETIIRAGEERILAWEPKLDNGEYTVRASLIYDLNRYNDPGFEGDRTKMFSSSLPITVK